MQNAIIDALEKSQEKQMVPFKIGDTVTVSVRLKEGDKERIQQFKGVVIKKTPKTGKGPQAKFTVRKISEGIGVERVFSLHSPFIEKIKVESSAVVRQSRLYYLRELRGKKARLKEVDRFAEVRKAKKEKAEAAAAAKTETQEKPEA